MELNTRKMQGNANCFSRNKSDIHPIFIAKQALSKVNSYKLFGLWIDDDLKWNTNTTE